MSVRKEKKIGADGKPREYWRVDFVWKHKDGKKERIRAVSPVNTKRGAEQHERDLREQLQAGTYKQAAPEDTPRVKDFWPEVEAYLRAERKKPSYIVSAESNYRSHIVPLLGEKRLSEVDEADGLRLKARLSKHAPKTVNNVLTSLSLALRAARALKILREVPALRMVPVPETEMEFYEDTDYERLVEAAQRIGKEHTLLVLLGGDAGLRAGEIMGLKQTDLRFTKEAGRIVGGTIKVQRRIYRGEAGTPKGGKSRTVPMTRRLAECLAANRHLAGEWALCRTKEGRGGEPVTLKILTLWMRSIQRRAGVEPDGKIHILRHTFCSRLAMRGVPAKAIQELAGHVSMETTMRYMHLSPSVKDAAIRALEDRQYGHGVATQDTIQRKGK